MSRALAFVIVLVGASFSLAAPRPNIVLMMSDDHHHAALSCAGSQVRTPNLDRLAAEGVRFTHCFVPNPICTPARAAIFTGQDNFINGCYFFGMPINPASPTFMKSLGAAGYDVWFTGKWHNDGEPATRGFTHGGPVWQGGVYDHRALAVYPFGSKGASRKAVADKYSSELFADAAVNFIEQRDKTSGAFCMVISFTTPHDPWFAPPPFDQMYDMRMMDVPANWMPTPPFKFAETFPGLRDQRQLPWPRSEWAIKAALTQYYGMITHMDGQIGRVMDALERQGIAQDTLVMFVGDHGYSMGSHGFVGKQTMYEEGIRTPLVVRYPRLKAPRNSRDELVSLMDIMPTMCEAAGVDIPGSVEGRSLLGLYRGESDWPRDRIFAAFESSERHGMATRCVRTATHKYIQHLLTGETEMYDLAADPLEMKNIVAPPEYAALRKELEKSLNDWRRRMKDPREANDQ